MVLEVAGVAGAGAHYYAAMPVMGKPGVVAEAEAEEEEEAAKYFETTEQGAEVAEAGVKTKDLTSGGVVQVGSVKSVRYIRRHEI